MWWLDELRDWWMGQRHPENLAFDQQHGTRTARFDWFNYEPSYPSVVEQTLDALDVELAHHTLIDLGSGKGRVPLIASRRGFRAVWGIEHRRSLHRTAEHNRARFEAANGPGAPIRLVHGDVTTAELPDGPLVVYLYNPFPASVLARFLRRVSGRDARLIYVHPLEADTVRAAGWQLLRHQADHPDPVRHWSLWGRTPHERDQSPA